MMTPTHIEALSRFFDGERVAPDLLTESLSQPGAVELLLEFARLSQMVTADTSLPDEEFCEAMRRRLRPSGFRRFLVGRLVPVAVAASLAMTAFAIGYGLRPLLDPPPPPPVPTVVPGAGSTSPVGRTADLTPPAAPPAVAAPPADRRERVGLAAPRPADRVKFNDWRETRSSLH